MKNGTSPLTIVLVVVGIVFFGCVVGGIVTTVRKAQQNRQAMKEFNAVSEEMHKDAADKIGKEDTVEGSADKAKQIQDAMAKTASKLSGDPAKAFRAGERLMGAMQSHISTYEKSYSGFLSKGGLEPKSLTSDEVIGERLVLLEAFEAANKGFLDFLKDAENKYRAELGKEDYPSSKLAETVHGFRDGANIDTLLGIRATDAELCVAMNGYLTLLKKEWGKWSLNEAGAVMFKSDGAATEFNGYAKQIQDVAARQTELQQKVLRARQKSQGAATGQ